MAREFDPLSKILRSPNTVFTFRDLALLWNDASPKRVAVRIHRYVERGELMRLRRGLYAKDKNYAQFEVAGKLYSPSYVSLETALAIEGVVFQYYETIFSMSYLTRSVTCDGKKYFYRRIKESALINTAGIENRGGYSVATKERALLDAIYAYKNYHFDNLRQIDWEKCFELVKIYENKEMRGRLDSYYKNSKRDV